MRSISKNVLSIMLAAMIFILSLAGCGSSSRETKTSTTASTAATAAATTAESGGNFQKTGMPIVKEPVTLDVLTVRWNNMDDSFKKNPFLTNLEKTSNVKIDWQWKAQSDWDTQKNIMLASGTLPSLILGDLTLSETDIMNNVEYFLPLQNLVKEYMPNYTKALNEDSYLKGYVTYPDGNMYSMGSRMPSRPYVTFLPTINKAWLDRLGLQVPTNMDELYNVLKAFKDKDANGNGDPNDEIPYSGSAKDALFDPTILINFGINELNGKYMSMADGKPAFFPTMDGFKQCVEMLHKWYQEGIMDKEYFTQDYTMLVSKYQSDPSRIGFLYSWVPDAQFTTTKSEYIAIPPLTGPDGKKHAGGDPNGLGYRRLGLEITKFCKYPEVAARWADEFYTGEASIQNFWGGIGTVITKNSDGTYELNNPPEGTGADKWYWDSSLRDFGPKYASPEFEKNIKLSKDSGDGLKLELDSMGKDYIVDPYPATLFTLDEAQETATFRVDIEKYVQTTTAKWITQGGIDEEWDSYVKQLDSMNVKRLVEVYTDAYNRFVGK